MEFHINKNHWLFLAKVTLALPIVAYVYFMFINPFFHGGWNAALKVWSSWQSLNVGFLAFASSIIAFSIARHNAEKQRKREFVAAKAFLSEALSELSVYFKQSATLYTEAYKRASHKQDRCNSPLTSVLPELPKDYRAVFSSCIHSATPDVGEHLAKILSLLQIHIARLTSEYEEFNPDSNMVKVPSNIMSNIYHLGKLQALVNKTFSFARGEENLDCSPLIRDDLVTAFRNLDIEIEQIEDLFEFTTRACERMQSET
jgi:hypothetical protein